MGGWVDGWMGGWVDVWIGVWMDGWMDGWVGGWMDGWVGGWVDAWMHEWMDWWVGAWMDGCFVLFCFVKNALVVLVPSRRLPIFSSVVRFPYPCITRAPENFHVFLNLYCQRKQNNLPLACTGRYLFWFFSCLSGRCCFCCGLIVAPVFV